MRGFTLAEVLVTLMVVGIVASMTIPAMLKNYNDKVRASSYKKAHSIMKQIYMGTISENGGMNYECSYSDPDHGIHTSSGCEDLWNAMKNSISAITECIRNEGNTIGKCIPTGGIKYPDGSDMQAGCAGFNVSNQNNSAAFILNNGQYIFRYWDFPLFAIDINGSKSPNQWNEDVFIFLIHNYELKIGGCMSTAQAKDIMLNN